MVKKTNADIYVDKVCILAKRNGVPEAEAMEKYTAFLKQGMKEQIAYFATVNEYRKVKSFKSIQKNRPQRKVDVVYGFILGTRGLWDKAATVRRQAESFIKKNGIPAAQEQGYIDGENHILDTRLQIFGKPNPNYGKPLDKDPTKPLRVLDHILYGYFRHNGDKKYRYSSIQTSDNIIATAWDKSIVQETRYFQPCQVTAIIDSEDKDSITLRASTAKDTRSIFKALDEKMDIKSIIDSSSKFTELKGVKKVYETVKLPDGKVPFDTKVIVKGVVTWMNVDRPDALGRVSIGIMNPDNEDEELKIRVDPTIIPLDFGELSEIYVFGKPQRSMNRNRETDELEDGDVVVDAFGIYVVSKTPKSTPSSEVSDEEVIDGWIK